MVQIDVLCRVSEDVCSYWRNTVNNILSKVGEVVNGFKVDKVLLVVGGEGVITASAAVLQYNVVLNVDVGKDKVSNIVDVLSSVARYIVGIALNYVGSCSLPVVEGVSLYIAYRLSEHVDKDVYRYLDEELSKPLRKDEVEKLRNYLDIPVGGGGAVVLKVKSGDISSAAQLVSKVMEFSKDKVLKISAAKLLIQHFKDVPLNDLNNVVNILRSRFETLCKVEELAKILS